MSEPQQPSQRPDAPAGPPPAAPFGSAVPGSGPSSPAPSRDSGSESVPEDQRPEAPDAPSPMVHTEADVADDQPTAGLPVVSDEGEEHATRQLPPVAGPSFDDTISTGPESGSERRPRRRGLVIAVVGVLVLAIVGVLGWRLVQVQRFEQALAEDSAAAVGAVDGYFRALSAADAEAALAVAAAEPAETSLLTDDVLASVQESGGLQDLRVGEASIANDPAQRRVGDTGTVDVSYTVGEVPVELDLPVSRTGDTWKVAAATSQVDLGGGDILRSVNGFPAGASVVQLFPGSYTVAAASPLVALAEPRLVVTAPDPAGAETQTWTGGQAQLSDEGRAAVLAAARSSLEACLGQRSLTPEGCPIAVDAGPDITVDTSTIRYSVVGSPWEDAQLSLDSDTRASGVLDLTYRIQASATSGGVAGVVAQNIDQQTGFVADLSGEEPQITWQ